MAGAYKKVMDSRRELVEKIISIMEEGTHDHGRQWSLPKVFPRNPESGAVYRGGNRLRLMVAAHYAGYQDPRWMTFRQIQSAGYRLLPGQHGVLCEKWIFTKTVKRKDEDGKEVEETEELEKPKVSFFYVFNAEQVEGYPKEPEKEMNQDIMKIADDLIKSSECPIYELPQDHAYYKRSMDHIVLPLREQFRNAESFAATLMHEMGHSTGHESRLNRRFGKKFGDEEYAREELRAELGALFIETDLGMEIEGEVIEEHSDYLASWISALRDDPNELFRACADAEKISERIVKNYKKCIHEIKEEASSKDCFVDEIAYHLAQKNYLYIQTSEKGYDYTFYDQDFKLVDGGQLDNLDLQMEEVWEEILKLHEIQPERVDLIPADEYESLLEKILQASDVKVKQESKKEGTTSVKKRNILI